MNDVVTIDARKPTWVGRVFRGAVKLAGNVFCIASLIGLLAVVTAIPVLQLIAFGYLLNVSGRMVRGATVWQSLPQLKQAGQIGLAALALFVAALPTQLLTHWESVATIIDPGSIRAGGLRVAAIAMSIVALGYLMWAWVRGGRLRDYLWPEPKRFFREVWQTATWCDAPDRLWDFTASLELPRYFWLGLRGLIATLVWLIPAIVIIGAFREGETGLAGLIGFIAVITLGIGLMYLPMLQAHFAAENRMRAMFQVRTIRHDFRRAPWAWVGAMVLGLVVLPIPLYLLKIEATPREVVWLPCLVFIAFILPARIAEGLALRRSRRQHDPVGRWAKVSRWLARIAMVPVIGFYLLFVYGSQYTSWDGLQTWVQQHAILIPIPFLSGT